MTNCSLRLIDNYKIKIKRGSYVKADKGYQSKSNGLLLREKGLNNHIMKRAVRNNPLTESQKLFNQLISKTRL